jgi:hypothetical protein
VAVPVSIDRVNVIGDQAVGITVLVPVMLEPPRAFVEPDKTGAPATDPEIARRIFVDAIDVRAFTERLLVARGGNIVGDLSRLSIESIESARKQACPQNAMGFLINRLDPAG